ncbi:MAG: hypothetical protein HYX68_12245 [Planctomycetes bacterium]|nr:hypothetical protein [Planctomycetota bacterium]
MAKKTKKDEDEQEDASDGSLPANDAWTGMLVISLLALMTGAAFLGWDWYQYNDEKGPPKVPIITGSKPEPPPIQQPKADDAQKKDEDKKKDDDKKKDTRQWRTPSPLGAVVHAACLHVPHLDPLRFCDVTRPKRERRV